MALTSRRSGALHIRRLGRAAPSLRHRHVLASESGIREVHSNTDDKAKQLAKALPAVLPRFPPLRLMLNERYLIF